MPPLLLLDIDGVLNPFAAPGCPPGFVEYELFAGEEPVRVCAGHGDWLRELGSRFSLVWATAWGEEANRRLAPLLGLDPLPVIPFPPLPFPPEGKLPAVSHYVGAQPLAWIDDALTPGSPPLGGPPRSPDPAAGHRPGRRPDPCRSGPVPSLGVHALASLPPRTKPSTDKQSPRSPGVPAAPRASGSWVGKGNFPHPLGELGSAQVFEAC
jgi:hypothetical protein